jgi:large conductance mechanosensitive channel
MSIAREFKQFAIKGNALDLAVGIVVGAAFGKIVSALVEKVLMPPLGLAIGGMDFSQLRLVLKAASPGGGPFAGEVAIGYGALIQACVDFFIVSVAVFALVKIVNVARAQGEIKPAVPEDVALLREILREIRRPSGGGGNKP